MDCTNQPNAKYTPAQNCTIDETTFFRQVYFPVTLSNEHEKYCFELSLSKAVTTVKNIRYEQYTFHFPLSHDIWLYLMISYGIWYYWPDKLRLEPSPVGTPHLQKSSNLVVRCSSSHPVVEVDPTKSHLLLETWKCIYSSIQLSTSHWIQSNQTISRS